MTWVRRPIVTTGNCQSQNGSTITNVPAAPAVPYHDSAAMNTALGFVGVSCQVTVTRKIVYDWDDLSTPPFGATYYQGGVSANYSLTTRNARYSIAPPWTAQTGGKADGTHSASAPTDWKLSSPTLFEGSSYVLRFTETCNILATSFGVLDSTANMTADFSVDDAEPFHL